MRTLSLITLSLFCVPCLAHVRWFVDGQNYREASLPLDALAITIFFVCIAFAALAYWITQSGWLRHVTSAPFFKRSLVFWRLYCVAIVAFFIVNSLTGIFIAPNLQLDTQHQMLGVVLQIAIALAMVVSVSLSGVFVIVLTIVTLFILPFTLTIDYLFELLGIGIALVLIGPNLSLADQQNLYPLSLMLNLRQIATIILRVMLGLQLLVLGFHNKLLSPGLSLAFLEQYPHYNVFALLGWEQFSHLHFVWFAGLCEILLGGMLMVGIANRIVVTFLIVVFTITTTVSGAHEVIGHLPIFAIALILFSECCNPLDDQTRVISETPTIRRARK
ncbi:hypothetical protein [Vibrio mexicanus]|uniref:hypothetical protein n=1 Tax=Vibrio mexicanus TaxID=1004326 RepID=UPI00063C32F2|nr:hypothetical protein [Vibrio mexicanus]